MSSAESLRTLRMSLEAKEFLPFPKHMRTFVLLLISFFQSFTSVSSLSTTLFFLLFPTTSLLLSSEELWMAQRKNRRNNRNLGTCWDAGTCKSNH